MKDNKNRHHHGRSTRSFDRHKTGRGSADVRTGHAWRFGGVKVRAAYFENEPHIRRANDQAAIPGKHLRMVREPERASHGKTSS